MADSGHSVIIGHPEETTLANYGVAPVTGGSPGNGPTRLIRENQQAAAASVQVDGDNTDQEILVVATRLKSSVQSALMVLTPRLGQTMALPCIGEQKVDLIRGIISNLKFKIKDKDFGPGRAGANLATSSTHNIPVEISNAGVIGYDILPGGLNYLVLHEAAHSFKQMRDFNKAQFEAYSKGAGKGLSLAERKAQFPDSPEFAENEARANLIARTIANIVNNYSYDFEPKHGYSTKC